MLTVRANTLRDYLQHNYLPKKLDMKPGSAHQLSVAVSLLDRWHGQPVLLADLSPLLLAGWLRYLKDSGRAPRTVNSRRSSVLTIWKDAAKAGLAMRFDPDDVPRCKIPKRCPTAWAMDELKSVLPHFHRPWMKTFTLLLFETGARFSAATLLTWQDWSLVRREVVLPAETSKTSLEQRLRVSESLAMSIERLRPLHHDPNAAIFPCPKDRRSMWRELKNALIAANLPHTRRDLFQKIRRTNATHTAANSSVDVAQRQLGHSSSRMTIDNYIDPRFMPSIHAIDVLPPL